MSLAAAFRDASAPPRTTVWLAAGALVAAAIAVQARFGMMGDVAWLIDCDERWLAGAAPYRDFIEINPPASLLVYWPAVALAKALRLPSEAMVVVFGLALAAASLALAAAILRRVESVGATLALAALAAFTALPGETFCERDHLAALFGAPAVALVLARSERARVGLGLALAAGAGTGIMTALKPPYALVVALPALYALRRTGLRAALKSPEYYAATAVALAYLALVVPLFPDYFSNVQPFLLGVYLPLRESLVTLIAAPGALTALLIGATAALTANARRSARGPFAVAGLAALGAALAYILQGKGWVYQAVPAMMFATVAGGAALGRVERTEAVALTAAAFVGAFGVALAHSLGLGWLLGAAAGFAVQAAASRDARLTTARLAPFAFAAAVGASAGLCTIERPLTPELEARLARLGPGFTLATISEDEGLAFPLVRRLGGRWDMRAHSLIVSGASRRSLSQHPGDEGLRAKLQPFLDRDRAMLVEDLGRRPDAILVGPLKSKLHADLAADAAVQAALADYRVVATETRPDYAAELWLRRDRVDSGR